MVQGEWAQDAHGEGVAAAGGDDDLNSGGMGGPERGKVARADVAVVAEQGAVHVNRDETGRDHPGVPLHFSLLLSRLGGTPLRLILRSYGIRT